MPRFSSAESDLRSTASKPVTLSGTMSAAHGFAVGDLHSMTAAKDQLSPLILSFTEADNHVGLTNRARLRWIHIWHRLGRR